MNNKGMSYIELILVVAISAMTVGLASLTIGMINRNNVTKAANKLESAFSKAQTLSMAKGSNKGCITILCKGDNYYYYFGSDSDKQQLLVTSPCLVEVIDDTGHVTSLDSVGVTYYFKNTTGAVDTAHTGGCSSLTVHLTNRGKTNINLNLLKTTGKCEMVVN